MRRLCKKCCRVQAHETGEGCAHHNFLGGKSNNEENEAGEGARGGRGDGREDEEEVKK